MHAISPKRAWLQFREDGEVSPLWTAQSSKRGGFPIYNVQRLSHPKWECKYHIIWMPKYRKKAILADL